MMGLQRLNCSVGSLGHVRPCWQPVLPLPCRSLVIAAAGRRQQQSKKRTKGSKQTPSDPSLPYDPEQLLEDYDLVNSNGTPILPAAPSPIANPKRAQQEEAPYPVFAPKPSNVKQAGQWTWSEDGDDLAARSGPPLPEWNPKTGFMKTRASSSASTSLLDDATATSSSTPQGSPAPSDTSALQEPQPISLLTPAADATQDLPAVTQSQVITSCVGTTFWMTVVAFFLRAYAQANAPSVLGTDEMLLAQYLALPSGLDNWQNMGILLGSAGAVTAARLQLQNMWPEFKVAMERSNKQILTPLNWFDIFLVAAMTGASEELLFRGAIIPGSFLDWRGVLLSGVIFGLLHNSGGRNLAFAAWASAVGCLYGVVFLYTQNIWVPVGAHAIANFASAAVWKTNNSRSSQ